MKALRLILDEAAANGRTVDLWWRDDDAVRPSPQLDRLLDLARSRDLPVAIAAVPGEAAPDLAARLVSEPGVDVLVHGWRHRNHEPRGAKSAEFGPARDLAAAAADMEAGLQTARSLFGEQVLPVFVPPWNRIAPGGAARLAALGYAGLSVFGPRGPAAAVGTVNTHLDPVDWRGGHGPVPAERLAAALAAALPSGEPVGLLTHHLTADDAIWAAIAALVETLGRHPAVRWTRARALWPAAPSLNRRHLHDLTWSGARGGSSG